MNKDNLLNKQLKKMNHLSADNNSVQRDSESSSLKMINSDEWLTSKEAAQYLKISAKTLYNLTSNGRVPFYKFGRSNRYKLNDLRNLLSSEPRGGYQWQ